MRRVQRVMRDERGWKLNFENAFKLARIYFNTCDSQRGNGNARALSVRFQRASLREKIATKEPGACSPL